MYQAERLDHLGIVAGVCREIGLAEWLDAHDEQCHARVEGGGRGEEATGQTYRRSSVEGRRECGVMVEVGT